MAVNARSLGKALFKTTAILICIATGLALFALGCYYMGPNVIPVMVVLAVACVYTNKSYHDYEIQRKYGGQ